MLVEGSDKPVIFSPELFSIQNYGGVTRSALEIVRALHARDVNWWIWAGKHGNEPLDILGQELGVQDRIIGQRQDSLPGRSGATKNEWGFRKFLKTMPSGVVHRTQYPLFDLVPRRFRTVVTLHDMWTERPEVRREEVVRRNFKRRALEQSDAIVCISEATRLDLVKYCPRLASRATVIHHGVRPVSDKPKAPDFLRPYFLYVGQREKRKNFGILLKALALAGSLQDFDLLCAGGGPFSGEEQAEIQRLNLGANVRQCIADDDELAGLYEHAVALVYPSRFEGFGMPLLEAMLHGCPVICSPVSCVPEIAGDAALYCDPDDPEIWADGLQKLAFDTEIASSLRHKGKSRAALFSWERAGGLYDAVYRGLM